MLMPRETPYLDDLNSYYLFVDKLTQHMQGEIGSGCIYCDSTTHEVGIFFNESEIIRIVLLNKTEQPRVYTYAAFESIADIFLQNCFRIRVFFLDPHAGYFWGLLPRFKRGNNVVDSSQIDLPAFAEKLKSRSFSGFVEVTLGKTTESSLLFFNDGERIGGSYSWGKGGLDRSEKTYNLLLQKLENVAAVFSTAIFLEEKGTIEFDASELTATQTDRKQNEIEASGSSDNSSPQESQEVSRKIIQGLEEFLALYALIVKKKNKKLSPTALLNERFMLYLDEYPFLDPFGGQFNYTDGVVTLAGDTPKEKIVSGIVECVLETICENNIKKQFMDELKGWKNRDIFDEYGILEEHGIVIESEI